MPQGLLRAAGAYVAASTRLSAYGKRKASRISKPEAGHLAKAGVEAARAFHHLDSDPCGSVSISATGPSPVRSSRIVRPGVVPSAATPSLPPRS